MIRSEDVTVILQGDIRTDTLAAANSVRQHLPGAHLIFSTFAHPACEIIREHVDELVINEDPGALPPTILSNKAPENNLNRQIVSTRAGLVRVQTPFALKLRSDSLVIGSGFLHIQEILGSKCSRTFPLVVSNYYTRHPDGISGYLFHVSDWFMFGRTDIMQHFWGAPLMSLDDATWYERNPHARGSTAMARRFRSRYSPEQHLTIHYAKHKGYAVPQYHNERTKILVQEYRRFLACECLVQNPIRLGFVLPKYAHVNNSFYLKLDCVSHADWLAMYAEHSESSLTLPGKKIIRQDFHRLLLLLTRAAAHCMRHPIAHYLLAEKHLRHKIVRLQTLLRERKNSCSIL